MNTEEKFYKLLVHLASYEEPTNKAKYSFLFAEGGIAACVHKSMYDSFKQRIAKFETHRRKTNYKYEKDEYFAWLFEDYTNAREMQETLSKIAKPQRRAARLEKARGSHLKEHYKTIWDVQSGKCYLSGKPLGDSFENSTYHVDHIEPIAERSNNGDPGGLRGSNWPTNLALLDPEVNRLKGDSDLRDFLKKAKRENLFKPTTASGRKLIDTLRRQAFLSYIEENS